MKFMLWSALIFFAAAQIAVAQSAAPRTDALGAHVNYGHGCTACHTPHSREVDKRQTVMADASVTLWGEDVPLRAVAGDGNFPESLPAGTSTHMTEHDGVLICLSCHDGNYGPRAMMKNTIYENLPATYGSVDTIPTLVDNPSLNKGNDIGDHPIGSQAQVRCGGALHWDCTEANGVISMEGTQSSRFAAHYGFFVKPSHHGNTTVAVCTTCHNPHVMNVTIVTASSASALFPTGIYSTRHFLRAPYSPDTTPEGSNRAAQFCRQCHADKSNEMNGGAAGSVP